VTILPFAGQCQRFTGAFPPFAALLSLFFRLPVEAVLLLADASGTDFEGIPGAGAVLLWLLEGGGRGLFSMPSKGLDERCVVCIEADLGG
jgi:hypothetical protein